MIAIIYISSAVRPFSDDELAACLAQYREKNDRLEITGILLYKDGDFMQLIEGPEEAVRSLAKTIYGDPRHHGIIQLIERKTAAREFEDWSMEFQNVSPTKGPLLAESLEDKEPLSGAGRLSPTLRLLIGFGWRP